METFAILIGQGKCKTLNLFKLLFDEIGQIITFLFGKLSKGSLLSNVRISFRILGSKWLNNHLSFKNGIPFFTFAFMQSKRFELETSKLHIGRKKTGSS